MNAGLLERLGDLQAIFLLPGRRIWRIALVPHEGIVGLGQASDAPACGQGFHPLAWEDDVWILQDVGCIQMEVADAEIMGRHLLRNAAKAGVAQRGSRRSRSTSNGSSIRAS